MNIYLTRHGQTELNKKKLMQGRSDMPLNERGIEQATEARKFMEKENIVFDAIYASPLQRAITTAAIIGGVSEEQVRSDERIIEADFGKYEQKSYYLLGPKMTLYWTLPEIFPAPETVEDIAGMVARSRDFLEEIIKEGKEKGYENILIACHGGIIRALSGVLENAPRGIRWRPKPKNCEIRKYSV